MQLDIWDQETPTSMIPRLNCTNDDDCTAMVDEHLSTCPVEQKLRDIFGY